jgi:hypothetical protein
MEVRKTRGGWRAEVVWRARNGDALLVHDLPPLPGEPGMLGCIAVWHSAAGVAYRTIRPRTVDQNFDLLPDTCSSCGR